MFPFSASADDNPPAFEISPLVSYFGEVSERMGERACRSNTEGTTDEFLFGEKCWMLNLWKCDSPSLLTEQAAAINPLSHLLCQGLEKLLKGRILKMPFILDESRAKEMLAQ